MAYSERRPVWVCFTIISVVLLHCLIRNAEAEDPEDATSTALQSTATMPLPQGQTPSQLPGQTGPGGPPPTLGTPAPVTPPLTAPVAAQTPPGELSGLGRATGNLQFVELRSFSNLTEITGDARNRSFLTGGYNNGVDLNYLEDFTHGIHHFELVTVGRYTDDPRVDPEHDSIQRAYFRINAPRYEINFGDYLVSYSRFTYNQNLKGIHLIWRAPWGKGFRLLANAGTFTDRYGSLFKETIPGKPYTRIVSGVRAEQTLGRDKLLALNWSYGNDVVQSIPIDPITGTQPIIPVQNNVMSLDSRMNFFRVWDMQAEAAYSLTNLDTRCNQDVPCPTLSTVFPTVVSNRKDYALRFDNTVRKGPWTFTEFFNRIMPSFVAINARQIADLQDVMARVSVQLSSKVSVQGTYRRTNDDLRGNNIIPETVFQLPEARVSFRDLPGLGRTLLDIGYRERHQQQAEYAQQPAASRITRTPYLEIGFPISSSVLTFDFEHRAYIDHAIPTNQTSANDASVSFRSVFNLGNWTFTPLVRYELNREIFDRVSTGNDNRTIQAVLNLEAPRYFIFEGLFREVGATLFQDIPQIDPLTFQPVLGPNGLPLYSVAGPSGFRRPAYHFSITYKLHNNENRTVTISYDRNSNRFALPFQNFYERVFQVTVLWRFRRE